MKYTTAFLLFILIAVLQASPASAQARKDPDRLYNQARRAAFEEKNYAEAISLSQQALELAPDYSEIRIFLGRLYFWSGRPDHARKTFEEVLDQHPTSMDARISYIDLELEQHNPDRALEMANRGLEIEPDQPDLLFRKGRALQMNGRDEEALRLYRRVRQIEPAHPHADRLVRTMERNQSLWKSTAGYTYETFSENYDPWHRGFFELMRKTSLGDLFGRVNYGKRFSTTDYQIQLEGYPRLTRTTYAYLDLGYSPNRFFPEYRFGLSLYSAVPHGFEGGLGLRYLHFNDPNLFIYTATLAKYISNYRISILSFLTPSSESGKLSAALSVRRYMDNPDTYVRITAGLGASPYGFNSQQDINRLNSTHIETEFQKNIGTQLLLRFRAGWLQERYQPNADLYRWRFGLALSYRF